ncbi:MAG TPA: cbb3-type cytochrome c oxidase subunit II [Anaeromyxobacter sp.]|nr:cbb3-type cytochrome c oxidase subunit II [Anaeromyxobacter sp.]
MAEAIYRKPVAFAVLATVVVLVGTVATMVYPMVRADMHPRVDGLKPLTALELAGRDVYQREGCMGCHTQTVRPLPSEVERYGGSRAQEKGARYSIAGEFAFDHPFLWGSKRTGPDLAFEGWLKPASWHAPHLASPQAVEPRSNMPRYAFLSERGIDGAEMQAHMRALRTVGVPYSDEEIAAAPAALQGKTEMDGLVAYLASLGKAVDRGAAAAVGEARLDLKNPKAGDALAVSRGQALFAENCAVCHGADARGTPDVAPSLVDDVFLGVKGDMPDGAYLAFIKGGSDEKKALGRPGMEAGGMPPFAGQLKDDDIWSIIAFLRQAPRP